MVFCDFIERTENTVKYAYGPTPEDISGEFVFDFKQKKLKMIREPSTEDAPIRHIHRLLQKYQGEFEQGRFKQKISYESA